MLGEGGLGGGQLYGCTSLGIMGLYVHPGSMALLIPPTPNPQVEQENATLPSSRRHTSGCDIIQHQEKLLTRVDKVRHSYIPRTLGQKCPHSAAMNDTSMPLEKEGTFGFGFTRKATLALILKNNDVS